MIFTQKIVALFLSQMGNFIVQQSFAR